MDFKLIHFNSVSDEHTDFLNTIDIIDSPRKWQDSKLLFLGSFGGGWGGGGGGLSDVQRRELKD